MMLGVLPIGRDMFNGLQRTYLHVKSAPAHRATATTDCDDTGPRVIDAGAARPTQLSQICPSLHPTIGF